MNDQEGKDVAPVKPLYRDLNELSEILVETRARLDGLDNLINRISEPRPRDQNKNSEEATKQMSWESMTLEQKVSLLRQAANSTYQKLIEVGNRLNSLI